MRFLHNARPYGNRAEIVILTLPGKGLILLPGLQDKVDPLLRHATCLFSGRIIGMMLIGRPTQEQHHQTTSAHGIEHGQFFRKSRSEEHTSELQSLMRISYAVFCLKKKNTIINKPNNK